jgi:hypothetical protein
MDSSLLFIRVNQLIVHVGINSRGLKKVWAGFMFCATPYRLSDTDLRIEAHYLVKDMGVYPMISAETYVTVGI